MGLSWVPAVNNHGHLGHWAFVEVDKPWNAKTEIRDLLEDVTAGRPAA